jgi:5'-3' exonuclease
MDCNSIIYDSYHKIEEKYDSNNNDLFETELIDMVIEKIKEYIFFINPSNTIFIAFDGSAPLAKMEQQRERRYKTDFLSKISFNTTTQKDKWSSSSITPGTNFMNKLSKKIEYEFQFSKDFNVKNIVVSSSLEIGEGEQKMFQYIRDNNFLNENIAVYGLDSDLIMLSILHLNKCDNIFIFREAPEFSQNIIPSSMKIKPNDFLFLDMKILSDDILIEMDCLCYDKHRIYDYIFLFFFLGNDFLPHFPALNIRTNGIQILLDTYRNILGKFPERFFISKTEVYTECKSSPQIEWKWVNLFITNLAKNELQFILTEYSLRNKNNKRFFPENTVEDKQNYFENIPVIYRGIEDYICPYEKYWEERYYKSLFKEQTTYNDNFINNVCVNYLETLEWTFKYYTGGCPNWRFSYRYNFPPLLQNLIQYVPHFHTNFITVFKPHFSPLTQLVYVIPKSQHYLLPKKIQILLQEHFSNLFPDKIEFLWAFKKYFWESYTILPDFSLDLLEKFDNLFNN